MSKTRLGRTKYEVLKDGNTYIVEFSRNARYDTFDGKYHPGWLVYGKNFSDVYLNKEDAFNDKNFSGVYLSKEDAFNAIDNL